MKKTLMILGMSLLTFACNAQSDIVDYNNIYVNNISISDFSPTDFETTIGVAEKSTYDIGFITDVYKIGENRFAFFKNSNPEESDPYQAGDLISFRVFTSDINIKINNTTIKVGDNIGVLKTLFPNSYNNYTQYQMIKIGLRGDMNGGSWVSEDSLKIEYDGNTQIIKNIILYYSL